MIWKSVVGKLWMTIIGLVALVLMFLGIFLLDYIEANFVNANDVKRLFVYTSIIGFLLTTFFAFFLSTKITQPLLELKQAANSITKGDYRPRVNIRSTDEIGELAHAFNHMAGELEETIKDLNHEKEQLGSILRSMTDAVITLDAEGQVVITNPQGENIIRDWSEISWDEPDMAISGETLSKTDPRAIPRPLKSLFDSVVAGTQELTSKIHVKNEVWSIVMTPLYTQDQVRGAVAVLRNVTEEYRLDKLRKDFVANVSHELRTPLSMLQGYSEALLDDIAGTPEERKELAQIIHDESLRMGRLVQNLLDLSRMETGNFQLHLGTVDVGALIQRVGRKFSTLARENGVHLRWRTDPDQSGGLTIRADEDRLEQVLINLVDNALRHSRPVEALKFAPWPKAIR